MESNKDEAKTALQRARTYLAEGDLERSRKFVKLSLRLFSTPEAEVFLLELDQRESRGGNNDQPGSSTGAAPAASHARHRRPHEAKVEHTSATEVTYTQEEVEGVKRILATKTHYETLNVTQNSEDEEIKRSYKKLAVKFHPDKNKAPKADEAFKKISKAYQTLSDAEKRRRYDLTGEENETQQHIHHQRHFNMNDANLFDIFDQMNRGGFYTSFGPGVHMRRGYRYRHQGEGGERGRGGEREEVGVDMPLRFLIGVIIVMLMANTLFSSSINEPLFTFDRTKTHSIQLSTTTTPSTVIYFVKESTSREISSLSKRELAEFERSVFDELKSSLNERCQHEERQRQTAIRTAAYYRQTDRVESLKQLRLDSCTKLHQMTNSKEHKINDEESFLRRG